MGDTGNGAVRRAAVIVAAGKGLRAGTDIPKQYLPLDGRPMLCHSVEVFVRAGAAPIVIVVPPGDEDYVMEEILPQTAWPGMHRLGDAEVSKARESVLLRTILRQAMERILIVTGGAERHDSVYEGLKACADSDYVWIHDAARPFVTQEILAAAMAGAEECGAAVPVIPVKDTIYVRTEGGLLDSVPEREVLYAAQTPQTFRTELILRAHEAYRGGAEAADLKVTDDATLVRRMLDAPVRLTEGSPVNLKVTTLEDVAFAVRHIR